MDTKNFTEKFYEKYGNRSDKPVLFFSPGRVNLIGEHTDYNGGFVFPCALNYGTYLLIRKTKVILLNSAQSISMTIQKPSSKGLIRKYKQKMDKLSPWSNKRVH